MTTSINADWTQLLERCSNVGKWGPNDELGTLNYITAAEMLRAVATVRVGRSLSLSYDLPVAFGDGAASSHAKLKVFHAGAESRGATDEFTVQVHGFDVTHVDALGHVYFEGRAYNGRQAGSIVSDEGLAFGSICAMRDGIVTRGILLDIAEVRGVDMLRKGVGVSLEDILEAERRGGVAVQRGDAIFIRSGIGLDKRWRDGSSVGGRPGVLPEVIPWIFDREVSVYSGDCIEQLPDIGDVGDMPLHQTGLVAMGLAILDNPNVEALRTVCNELGRREFMLIVAPLRIPGGTGSAVNPLALF